MASAEEISFDEGDESFMELLNTDVFEAHNPNTASSLADEFHSEFKAEPSPPTDDTKSRESTPQDFMDMPSPSALSNEENGSTSGDSEGGSSKPALYGRPPNALDPKEDKKRRNRLAAKMSRAKKKRVMQSIEERQEYLEQERLALKKENEELRNTNRTLENQLAFFHGIFKANTDAKFKLPDGVSLEKTSTVLSEVAKSTVPQGTGLAMGFVFLAVFSAGRMDDFGAEPRWEKVMQPEQRRAGRMLLSTDDDEMDFADMGLLMPSLGIAHATAMAAGLAVVAYLLIWAFNTYFFWVGLETTPKRFKGPARMTAKQEGGTVEGGCRGSQSCGAAPPRAPEQPQALS